MSDGSASWPGRLLNRQPISQRRSVCELWDLCFTRERDFWRRDWFRGWLIAVDRGSARLAAGWLRWGRRDCLAAGWLPAGKQARGPDVSGLR